MSRVGRVEIAERMVPASTRDGELQARVFFLPPPYAASATPGDPVLREVARNTGACAHRARLSQRRPPSPPSARLTPAAAASSRRVLNGPRIATRSRISLLIA